MHIRWRIRWLPYLCLPVPPTGQDVACEVFLRADDAAATRQGDLTPVEGRAWSSIRRFTAVSWALAAQLVDGCRGGACRSAKIANCLADVVNALNLASRGLMNIGVAGPVSIQAIDGGDAIEGPIVD